MATEATTGRRVNLAHQERGLAIAKMLKEHAEALSKCQTAPGERPLFRPLSGLEIGRRLGISGDEETIRRRVREGVTAARNEGVCMCARGDGYWLARDAAEWTEYLEARKSGAKFEFVAVRRMTDATTQPQTGSLFAGGIEKRPAHAR